MRIARNNENAAIVAWVCRALKERVASYRYALERLVIAVPSSSAAEADRAIALLATRRRPILRRARRHGGRARVAARGRDRRRYDPCSRILARISPR